MKSIVLMGIKHCGKSTQGKLLARELNVPFYDTDDVVTELSGKTPRQIYTESGQEAFLETELKACEHVACLVEQSGESAVIATGGGICANKMALEALHKIGTFVFLIADESVAANRIIREARVLADGTIQNLPAYIAKKNPRSIQEARDYFHEFYVERTKIYSDLSDVSIRMDNSAKTENMHRILQLVSSH